MNTNTSNSVEQEFWFILCSKRSPMDMSLNNTTKNEIYVYQVISLKRCNLIQHNFYNYKGDQYNYFAFCIKVRSLPILWEICEANQSNKSYLNRTNCKWETCYFCCLENQFNVSIIVFESLFIMKIKIRQSIIFIEKLVNQDQKW